MYDEVRLEVLLDSYFDQELTVVERTELEQMLLASARARELFWDRAQHHSFIREWGMQEWGRKMAEGMPQIQADPNSLDPKRPLPPFGSDRGGRNFPGWLRRGFWGWGVALAACLALSLVLWRSASSSSGISTGEEAPDPAVAILTRAAGVAWADRNEERGPGTAVEPGWLNLKQGVIHLEFYSGARLTVEGPAELQLISSAEVFCKSGKVNAHVPEQGQGFRFRSPDLDVVDLGTTFAVNVSSAGPTELHVFTGEVEVTRVGTRLLTQRLSQGQSLRVNSVGEVREIPSAAGDFVTLAELARRESAELADRLDAWRIFNQSIAADPLTLVHYTFDGEPDPDNSVKNHARPDAAFTDGSIIGCEWVSGRWPGKAALGFKSRSDRVRLNVPGEQEALTYVAWVRVDSLPRANNGLLLSDDLGIGEVRWELTSAGEIRFGVRVQSNAWERALSPAVVTPDRFGQWLHVASVFDARTRVVQHYLNGQPVGNVRLRRAVPAALGRAELGNWSVRAADPRLLRTDEAYLVRSFTGRIDEILIAARTYNQHEIREHYRVGKPSGSAVLARLGGLSRREYALLGP